MNQSINTNTTVRNHNRSTVEVDKQYTKKFCNRFALILKITLTIFFQTINVTQSAKFKYLVSVVTYNDIICWSHFRSGWLGRAMVLGSFQCRSVLLIWHMHACPLPRLKMLHFLSNEERLVNISYTGTINKGPVYHCYRERFSLLTETDKEISISSVLTNN